MFYYHFIYRLENQTLTKLVNLDIEISDFFQLNYFQSDGKGNDNLQNNFKPQKVLMSGRLEEELVGIYKDGGID